MKIILSIILILFSVPSFADLEGKVLLCESKWSISGYTFMSNYKYHKHWVGLKNDTYKVNISPLHDYKMNPEVIILYLGMKINRKTLRRFDSGGKDFGKCELVFPSRMRNRIEEHKNEKQKIYNKKLEGNKI